MGEFRLPTWSARNPLAIVALFISLIYGMSAVLLGASIEKLATYNQTALVAFVIGFPFVVLFVFGWLVSRHHTKLYGPGDYRKDESFLNAGRNVPSEQVGKRLEIELGREAGIEESERLTLEAPKAPSVEKPSDEKPEDKISNLIFTNRSADPPRLHLAYFAESLAFQALQAEFGGSIRRQVAVSQVHVDGLIYAADGSIFVVEVKIVSGRTVEIGRRIREARDYLNSALSALKNEEKLAAQPLVVIVVDGNLGRVAEINARVKTMHLAFEVRVYGLSELISRFGLDDRAER